MAAPFLLENKSEVCSEREAFHSSLLSFSFSFLFYFAQPLVPLFKKMSFIDVSKLDALPSGTGLQASRFKPKVGKRKKTNRRAESDA